MDETTGTGGEAGRETERDGVIAEPMSSDAADALVPVSDPSGVPLPAGASNGRDSASPAVGDASGVEQVPDLASLSLGELFTCARSGPTLELADTIRERIDQLKATRTGGIDVVPGGPVSLGGLDLDQVADLLGTTAIDGVTGLDHPQLLGLLSAIGHLTSAVGALTVRALATLDHVVRAEDAAKKLPARRQGVTVAQEASFALGQDLSRTRHQLGTARRLVTHMPRVFGALAAGRISPEAAHAASRGAAPLDPVDVRAVDRMLGEHMAHLEAASSGQWQREVAHAAHRLAPQKHAHRHQRARENASVWFTPAAYGMATMHADMTALDATAIRKKLDLAAEHARLQGDERTAGQVKAVAVADTLLGRDETMEPLRLEVGVMVTDRALLDPTNGDPVIIEGYGPAHPDLLRDALHERDVRTRDALTATAEEQYARENPRPVIDPSTDLDPLDDEDTGNEDGASANGSPPRTPATLPGVDPVQDAVAPPHARCLHRGTAPSEDPATVVERWVRATRGPGEDLDPRLAVLRRIYTHPVTGELVAMDATSRHFPAAMARQLRWRDERCAAPYCNASIRHLDHITPWTKQGPTSLENGQGLCAACNYAKELVARVTTTIAPDGRITTWTTPNGHTMTTRPPTLSGRPDTGAGTDTAPVIPARQRRRKKNASKPPAPPLTPAQITARIHRAEKLVRRCLAPLFPHDGPQGTSAEDSPSKRQREDPPHPE